MEGTDPKYEPKKPEAATGGKNTGMAIVAYILFFVPLLTDAKNDPFVKFHVKQGLVLFLAWCVLSFVAWMPFLRWISWMVHLALFIVFIMGILNAANGKEEELPVIGKFAKNFNF